MRARVWFAKAAAWAGLVPPVSREFLDFAEALAADEAEFEVLEPLSPDVESEVNAPSGGEVYGPRALWGPAEPLDRIEYLLEDIRNLLSSLADVASDVAPPGQPHHAQGGAGVGGSAPPLPVLGGADPIDLGAARRAADERITRKLRERSDRRK